MEGTAELFTGFAERIAREKGTQQEMMREGDYIEDGLIHCGKCRGKRQTRVKIPGGDGATITVPCMGELIMWLRFLQLKRQDIPVRYISS